MGNIAGNIERKKKCSKGESKATSHSGLVHTRFTSNLYERYYRRSEEQSPCWWGTLSPLVSTSFAAALPLLASPPLFDFSLSSVCWKSWLCCSHWAFWGSVRRIVLCLSVWWEKLGKTMSGGRTGPLWCPFHLSSFSVLAFPDDSDDLCRPPTGVHHLTPCIVKHTIMCAQKIKKSISLHEHVCLKSPDILSP